MKRIVYILSLLIFVQIGLQAQNEETKKRNWIIPAYVNIQYAGGVGNYVIGAGYTLNKSQSLRFSFHYGFTPKFKSKKNLHITSLKFSYLPIDFKIYKKVSAMPVISIGSSRVFADGPGTFTRLPSYYPEGYYAPNAFRFHFSIGADFKYRFKDTSTVKALEFYVETTTNDLYLKYYFNYNKIHFTEIFTMALGVNIMFK